MLWVFLLACLFFGVWRTVKFAAGATVIFFGAVAWLVIAVALT